LISDNVDIDIGNNKVSGNGGDDDKKTGGLKINPGL